MRRPLLALPLAAATVAFAACQETVHLYPPTPDGGGSVSAVGGHGGKGGSSGGNDAGNTDGRCQQYQFTPDTPQIVIALDRSSNMTQTFPGTSTSHLSAAVHAIYSDVGLYISGNSGHADRAVSFWFLDFPDSGMGCTGQSECCAKDAVRTSNMSTFNTATGCEMSQPCVSSSYRPLRAALANADQAFNSPGMAGSPRYVVLVTDGDPGSDCSPDDCTDALMQAQRLRSDGVHLYVVSIAGDQSSCLFDLANAVNASTDPPYLAGAASAPDVSTDISNAISAALCKGTLSNPPSSPNGLEVVVGSYEYSTTDGWTYDPQSGRLQLHGSACQNYVQFGGPVQVSSGCTGRAASGAGSQ